VLNVTQVQVRRLPPAQQQDLAGDLGGHIGIAVPIPTHPGDKGNRNRIKCKVFPAVLIQGPIQSSQELGDRLPQGILYHREPPLGLVHRRGALGAKVIAVPDLSNQLTQTLVQALPFSLGQAFEFQLPQAVTDFTVLVDQGAAGDLSRVGGQHQLDFQLADRLDDCLRGDTFLQKFAKALRELARGGQQRVHMPGHGVVCCWSAMLDRFRNWLKARATGTSCSFLSSRRIASRGSRDRPPASLPCLERPRICSISSRKSSPSAAAMVSPSSRPRRLTLPLRLL
jgi:hypothetical protein